MQLKLQQIVESEQSFIGIKESSAELNKPFTGLLEIEFPAKIAYRIKKVFDKITPELKTFAEKREELFKKYGTLDEETNKWTVTKENMPSFIKEVQELLDIDVNVDIEPINSVDLGDVSVKPSLLISWLFI